MTKPILLITLILSIHFVKAQRPGSPVDITHYQFSISLTDSSNLVNGNAAIDFAVIKDTRSITFDLITRKANGNGMSVISVKDKEQSLTYTHENDLLTITLPATAKKGDKKTLVIQYEGIPADGLIIANNKYKHRGFFADNWPNRARNWIPCVDHPSDKASVDFIVMAPVHYQVVANGIQVEETSLPNDRKLTHYKEVMPLATKIMTIGVSGFAVQYAGDAGNIPVYSWVYPEDRDKGFYDYALAVDILPWFVKMVGPYAYKKLANVQSKTIFGGLENANTIFYSEDHSITGKRKSESLLAHEIAHQWFGNMATEADWPHLWLSEGFATYMTILYFENKYGRDTARKMLIEDRQQVIDFSKRRRRPVVDTSVTDYMQLLNANSYQKGGWALHMLRQQLGDEIFRKGIRAYYSRYAGKNAVTDDLRKVMEEVSRKDLKMFFRQWLYTPGQPELDISWQYDETKKMTTVTIVQQQETLFQFPLEVMVRGGSASQRKVINIKDKQSILSFSSPARPEAVIPDPDVKLLFDAKVNSPLQ